MQRRNEFEKLFKSNKSQIIIFVLIAILIIVLFIFLIFLSNNDKKGNLEDSKNAIILEDNQKLSTLKSAMDHCLEIELRKALIISGLRGGFIYNKGEYYFPGTIPPNTYTQTLVSNLGLNWNNLQSRTLVHSQAQVYTPGIDNNVFMYTHSITQDMEKYISKNFIKCINFENTQGAFEIDFIDYIGIVRQIDYDAKVLEIDSMHAVVGDVIDVDLPYQTITGNVTKYLESSGRFIVQFNNVSFLSNLSVEEMTNLDVINLNRSLNLSVNINNEDVSANLNFPIKIKSNNFRTTYEDSTVVAPVRYKSLLDLSKELLSHKYLHEKNIDYTESENIIRVLNNSKYFQSTNLTDISFSKKILIDEKEHKRFIYTLIDKDSKILGKPFALNFAYENIAPVIDFASVDSDMVIDSYEQVITLLATQNDVIEYDLRPFTFEKQYWDDYILYYEPVTYYGPDAEFNLYENGTLYFMPFKEKVYRFNIHVTDGETTREHILEFVTGFPDNTGNIAADECFEFRNFNDSNNLFPINYRFNNAYDYYDEDRYTMFGLVNYIPNSVVSGFKPGNLYFSKSCVFDPSKFEIVVTSDGTELDYDDLSSSSKYSIEIPNKPHKQTINVSVKSKHTGTEMTEPFQFVVVPSSCLGPAHDDPVFNLTCCDVEDIETKVNDSVTNKDVDSLNLLTPSPLKSSGERILDKDIYICFNPDPNTIFKIYAINYQEEIIWEVFPLITSLFKSHIIVECDGKYPRSDNNVKSISIGGGTPYGDIIATSLNGIRTNYTPPIPLNMKIDKEAEECEFCIMNNESFFDIVAEINGEEIVFNVGLAEDNSASSDTDVIPIPMEPEYNDVFVKCNDNWYGSKEASNDPSHWTELLEDFVKGGDRTDGFVSPGYCSQGSDDCAGRTDPAVSIVVSDPTNVCRDNYFNYLTGESASKAPPSSWVCGSYTEQVCNATTGLLEDGATLDNHCIGLLVCENTPDPPECP